ncbi:Localized to the inner membrane of the chloroplast [Senna tora]|uniref:Localized to the inner membrane of the chloroplast n=1 Tax=Senna tora TaxID=362788 RepID=A0A834TY88_9FABA|nr:Localized to the inner membrane of the chloroplast [Senna tora]
MAAVSGSMLVAKNSPLHLPFAPYLNELDYCRLKIKPSRLSINLNHQGRLQLSSIRRPLKIQAAYSDDGRPSSASIFVGGFILGGLIVGTLGCVYAPQISKALAGADRKEFMRKLPKFIYDEEKALEKTRKVLAEKIAQLNSAIDDVSAQLRSEEAPNGVAVNSDEVEAAT